MEIKISNLNKRYGKFEALKNINLEIGQGMYGLLGRNGAGKTTILRILATMSSKTDGEILINSIPIENRKEIRKIIGYLPQGFSVYPNMSVWNTMEYFDILSEMPTKYRKQRIQMLLQKVNLWEERKRKVKHLSGGMKQRLGIALTLINNPQIIIADEPTAGLDPEERIRLRNMLNDLSKDKIVILSTHIVDDISTTCNKIGVLHEGNLLFDGEAKVLENMALNKVFIVAGENNIPKDAEIINKIDGKIRILSNVLPMGKYEKVMPTLEDGYIELIKNEEVEDEII
jgi:ABC-2 type transport system ATP-binding protein